MVMMMVRLMSVVAAMAAVVAAGAATGSAASAPKAESWACNPNATLTVLFHPHGHGPIESLDFPAWTVPHVEFYKGARPGLDTYLIYAGTHGQGAIPAFTSNPYCLPGEKTTPFLPSKAMTRLKSDALLTCSFSKRGRFLATKVAKGSYRIQAVVGTRVVVDAQVKPQGSLVTYAATSCERSAVPE
jgi:hypothetical protein